MMQNLAYGLMDTLWDYMVTFKGLDGRSGECQALGSSGSHFDIQNIC